LKFVHAADLHNDSPLRGLEEYPGAPVARVRLAPRAALENLVQLCLEEQVSFLVISGDLFDYDWRDFNTALFVVNQFRRLEQEGIPVFMIRGNHDSREEMSFRVPWPKNVTLFDHQQPQSFPVEQLDVVLHGMSFPKREVKENLVPRYPAPVKGMFNIGLLHTNATGSADHDAYAPCSLDDLTSKGYDYWALGHVHQHGVLHTAPYVVYSGNTQGRHIRECGEKGCVLLTVDNGEVTEAEFRSTDVLRWYKISIELADDDGLDELYTQARRELRAVGAAAEGRLAGVRLEVVGNCEAHRSLVHETGRKEVVAELRTLPGDFTDDLWIEKIKFATRPAVDREELCLGQDLIGDLLRSIDDLVEDPRQLSELAAVLKPLANKVGGELALDEIDFTSQPQLARWVREAEAQLLSQLTEDRL
jgi:exonuclease SbcD